jgi:hypothetical protein
MLTMGKTQSFSFFEPQRKAEDRYLETWKVMDHIGKNGNRKR